MSAGYRYETYGSIRVAWTEDLDGGGRSFGQQILPAVRTLIGPVDRVCEFCAGPGFMGFSLLAAGLCDSLYLVDVNPAAVAAVAHTIALNGLADRVSVRLSSGLASVPATERWDLVVSNPPHFDAAQTGEWGLRAFDPGWRIHRQFYAAVRRHLKPHGQCLFVENYHGSSEETYLPMLEDTGLAYAGSFMINDRTTSYAVGALELPPVNTYYFYWTRVKHDEIVWRDAGVGRRVDVRLEPSGVVLQHDGQVLHPGETDAPLRLPIGRQYALVGSSRKEGWRLDWDFTRNQVRSRPSATGEAWSVVCIPTAPSRIVDDAGRVLVEFE